MIQNTKTIQKITTTKKELLAENEKLNEFLQKLTEENVSRYEQDRAIIRKIRDQNLETIQLIDRMSYRGIVSL